MDNETYTALALNAAQAPEQLNNLVQGAAAVQTAVSELEAASECVNKSETE